MFGAGGGTSSYREVEEADCIVLWGSNAREAHPIFFHHVLKAVQRGAKLYVVDPRRTSTAEWADGWLSIEVGHDIALANGVAHVILEENLQNDAFIARATEGISQSVKQHGPSTFGIFSCSKATNEVNYAAQKFIRAAIGSNNIDSCNRT